MMIQIDSKRSKRSKPTEKKDEDLNCRLRHGLNPYCLFRIFKFLPQRDLMILSRMNDFYKQVISENVLTLKEIVFDFFCENNDNIVELFRLFGKNLKNIKLKGDVEAFKNLNQLIKRYCNADQLKKVDLRSLQFLQPHFDEWSRIMDLVEDVDMQTFYRSLKEVSVNDYATFGIPQKLFRLSEKIQVLKFIDVKTEAAFTDWTDMPQLKEIHLVNVNITFKSKEFINFVRDRPHLKYLFYENIRNSDELGEVLAESFGRCSNLMNENASARRGFMVKSAKFKNYY